MGLDEPAEEGLPRKTLPLASYAPYDPMVDSYVYSRINLGFETAVPLEYDGWREEQQAGSHTCWLHAGLNPSSTYRVTGPDALRFFSETCVNGFSDFPIGTLKHAIMCSAEGLVMAHGVLLRTGEQDFLSYYLAPYAAFRLQAGAYDARGEFVQDGFVFQIAGPRALEVLETAAGECVHDIGFGHHRWSTIQGRQVRIARLGMAGGLAYEVHGSFDEALHIYEAILRAGEPLGMRKLGLTAYRMNHTPAGFPQAFVHFPCAWREDPGFMAFLAGSHGVRKAETALVGSMGTDIRLRYRNPVELGWANMVKFDHDFTGRAALAEEVATPKRRMVTLVWDPDDIAAVAASHYQPGEPYMALGPIHPAQRKGVPVLCADRVLNNGEPVGISSGRTYSYHYRQMLSLCSLDVEEAELGNEVVVLWGDRGTRQKDIRATVSRFPYLNEGRNEDVDVATIPCVARK